MSFNITFEPYIDANLNAAWPSTKVLSGPAPTIVKLPSEDAIFNFYADAIDTSIQKNGATVLDEKLAVSVAGNSIVDVLTTAYGSGFVSAENNADEIRRLSELGNTGTVIFVVIKEEKYNDDGAVTTVYEFSTQKHKGTLKEKEVIGAVSRRKKKKSQKKFKNEAEL